MRKQCSMLTSAIGALGLLFSFATVRAGDPIQFSTDKSKPAPGETRPADAELFKSWNKSKGAPKSPLNSLTPFIPSAGGMDPKEDRRLKNVREEKKNWMLLEPGELQRREEEEENKFGGRGIAMDNEDETGNYLFHNVTQQRADQSKQNPQRADDSEEQAKKDTRGSLSVFGPREADKQGAHTASQLNLKGLVDPSQVNAADFKKNEASLFEFLKDNSPPQADRDQQARRDSFRNFINGPQPNAPSGISDPINFRTDLTQERLNPTMPSRPAFDPQAGIKSSDAFSAKPPIINFNPTRAMGSPETLNAQRQAPPGAGPHLPSPLLMQPRASVSGNNSLFNREAPRRGGL